jgi:Flp pilus assembly pilin Flp
VVGQKESRLRNSLHAFLLDESGQSVTEYGAVIAFVSVLVALAFALSRGTLFAGISGSFSVTTSHLDAMNQASFHTS